MTHTLMILPAADPADIRLIKIPKDFEQHEVFRSVTSLIASVEENNPDYNWNDIAEVLEDHGFEIVPFILGPTLD